MVAKQVAWSLWLRSQNAGMARNKAHDHTHGIHKIIEHRANHSITLHMDNGRGTMFIRLAWSNINKKSVMRELCGGGLAEKYSRLSGKLTSAVCHADGP